MSDRFFFNVPIGDWSGDGHSQQEIFRASSAVSIEKVREAFFEAKVKFPGFDPESFCSDYQDKEVSPAVVSFAKDTLGFEINPDDFGPEDMFNYILAYLNHADKSLDLRVESGHTMLPFYGHDDKGRHIGFIGYGLFD